MAQVLEEWMRLSYAIGGHLNSFDHSYHNSRHKVMLDKQPTCRDLGRAACSAMDRVIELRDDVDNDYEYRAILETLRNPHEAGFNSDSLWLHEDLSRPFNGPVFLDSYFIFFCEEVFKYLDIAIQLKPTSMRLAWRSRLRICRVANELLYPSQFGPDDETRTKTFANDFLAAIEDINAAIQLLSERDVFARVNLLLQRAWLNGGMEFSEHGLRGPQQLGVAIADLDTAEELLNDESMDSFLHHELRVEIEVKRELYGLHLGLQLPYRTLVDNGFRIELLTLRLLTKHKVINDAPQHAQANSDQPRPANGSTTL